MSDEPRRKYKPAHLTLRAYRTPDTQLAIEALEGQLEDVPLLPVGTGICDVCSGAFTAADRNIAVVKDDTGRLASTRHLLVCDSCHKDGKNNAQIGKLLYEKMVQVLRTR